MNEIINVAQGKIGGDVVQTVNARELHKYLGVGRVFAAWITERIEKYGFASETDYTVTTSKSGIRQNVLQKDYHISLDMAKELSMVENNAQGMAARRYFIQCEKQLQTKADLPALDNPAFLRTALLSYTEQVILLTQNNNLLKQDVLQLEQSVAEKLEVIVQQTPAVQFVNKFVAQGLNLCLRDAWKGLGLSPTIFNRELVAAGVLFRSNGGKTIHAKQAHIQAGHFVQRISEFGTQTLVTPKGITYIAKRYL